MFDRISVCMDDLAPNGGAFVRASDWAARLHIPLHGVVAPVPIAAPDPLSALALRDCDTACAAKGVRWDTEFLIGSAEEVGGFFRGTGLSAFSASLSPVIRNRLLHEASISPRATAMICSPSPRLAPRTLVLHRSKGSGIGFLQRVVPLCRDLGVPPVVLTVARSERRATELQGLAREVFSAHGLAADFDLIAGCGLRAAVARAAMARDCGCVILEREPTPPWWRQLWGSTARSLLGLADRLTVVTMPRGDAKVTINDATTRCGQGRH